MHESSLMAGLLAKIESAARANSARKVTAVQVSIGALAAISPEHLKQHFEAAAAGTLASGAELRVSVSTDPCAPHAHDVLLEAIDVGEAETAS